MALGSLLATIAAPRDATAGALDGGPVLPGFNSNSLAGNDDLSTGAVPLGFRVNFFGVSTNTVFVNNNGNVTFNSAYSEFTPPTGIAAVPLPIIAPFFADVDTRVGNVVTYGTGTVGSYQAFGVNWPGVGYYSQHVDKLNTFQLVIISRPDTGIEGNGNFDFEFNYNHVQWETGDASQGVNGLGGTSAAVGWSNGAGTFFQLPGSLVNGAFLDTGPAGTALILNSLNSTEPGQYVFQVRNGVVIPVAADFWLGNTSNTWMGANWVDANGVASASPTSASNVVFSATQGTPANQNTQLGSNFTIQSLLINDPVPVTISGNTLTISGVLGQTGIVVNLGAGLVTINSNLVLAGVSQNLTVNNAAGMVINGVISGSSGLTASGASNLTLGAANTYTGSTQIAGGGTLTANIVGALPAPSADGGTATARTPVIMDQSGPGGSTLALGANQAIASLTGPASSKVNLNTSALTVGLADSETSTEFDGVISGGGSLIKDGTSTQILGGTNTYTGATIVNGGVLEVNGSIASATTTVNSLGTLQGIGIIGGHLVNNGTVSPGSNSGGPGLLKVTGNYTQNSSGNLRIGLASTSTFGRLQVNGMANLNGTITAISVNGFQPQVGNSFQVVTANGGLNGTFSNLNNQTGTAGTLLNLGVTYTSTTATLQFVQNPIPIPGHHPQPSPGPTPGPTPVSAPNLPFTPNGIAVAQVINGALNDPRMAGILAFLDRQPLGALPGLLDRISPEELSSLVNATTSLSNVQTQNIEGRLEALQTGTSGFTAQALHIAGSGPYYAGGFNGPTGLAGPNGEGGKEVQAPAIYNPRLGTFVTGEGEWVSVGNTDNARGYDLVTGGFTLGVDYKFTPNLALGINAGYAHTGADLENGGRSTIDSGKFGFYGTYFTGGFYVDAAVTGGYNSYSSRRSGLQGTAYSDTDGGELDTLFGTGYYWHTGGLSFGPTGNFQYTYTETKAFTEHGSLAPMSFPSQSVDSIRSAFGLKAIYDWKVGGVLIRPELAAAWQHEYGDNTPGVITSFANGAGGQFTVFGPEYGRDSLLLRGGFAIIWNDRASSYVYYDGELARQNYGANTVSGGVRVTF